MACNLIRTCILTGLLVFILLQSFGQNLVPNPGFEKFRQKPCGIIGTDDPIGLQDFLFDWRTPTSGSSDLWYADTTRECYANSFIGVYPVPRTGKFCIGLITSLATSENYKDLSQVEEYREYIQTRLAKPLKKGKLYYAEYYVFRIFSGSIATNNFGAVFSNSAIGSIIPKKYPALNYNPQIKSSEVVTDTARWTKISGCFMAEDNYEYLTIGNFSNDAATTMVPMYYKGLHPYYLVDDVLVEEVDINLLPEPGFLGPDTTICQGEEILLKLDYLRPYSFLWQDGSVQSQYLADKSGIYSVELSYKKCIFKDTVQVKVKSPINLGSDITICESQPLVLKSENKESVLWQDGSESPEFTANNSGIFIARSLSLQCPSMDSVTVNVLPCPGFIPNVFTPNSDEKNDYFVVDNIMLSEWKLEVFNRWGKRIYHNQKYDNSWDGQGLSSGMYYYVLFSPSLNQSFKGWVNILR